MIVDNFCTTCKTKCKIDKKYNLLQCPDCGTSICLDTDKRYWQTCINCNKLITISEAENPYNLVTENNLTILVKNENQEKTTCRYCGHKFLVK